MARITAQDRDPGFYPSVTPSPTPVRPVTGGPLVRESGTVTPERSAPVAAQQGATSDINRGQVSGDVGAGIGGGIANIALLLGAAGRGGKRYLKDALNVYMKLQSPDFDMRDLDPAEYEVAAIMFPEQFEAQLPGEASLIADSPLARAQQAEAVAGMGEISRTGLPEADRLAAEEGARAVRGAQRGGEQSAIRSLRRRGRLGAGQELLARDVGGREASDLAARLGSDLQRQALERRMLALSQYGSMANLQRGQDLGVEQSRADAMNRFKEFSALQRQQAEQYGAGARERAQGYNVGTAQEIANANVSSDYATQLANLQRQNELRQTGFQNEALKAQGTAGVYGALYSDAEAKQAAKAKQIRGIGTGVGGAVGGLYGLS